MSLVLLFGGVVSVSTTLTPTYDVRQLGTKTLAPTYDIRNEADKELTPTYNIRQLATKTLAPTYNVVQLGTKTLTPTYDVRQLGTQTLAPSYDVRQLGTKTLTPTYDIQATGLTPVSKTLTPTYDVREFVSKTVVPTFRIWNHISSITNISVSPSGHLWRSLEQQKTVSFDVDTACPPEGKFSVYFVHKPTNSWYWIDHLDPAPDATHIDFDITQNMRDMYAIPYLDRDYTVFVYYDKTKLNDWGMYSEGASTVNFNYMMMDQPTKYTRNRDDSWTFYLHSPVSTGYFGLWLADHDAWRAIKLWPVVPGQTEYTVTGEQFGDKQYLDLGNVNTYLYYSHGDNGVNGPINWYDYDPIVYTNTPLVEAVPQTVTPTYDINGLANKTVTPTYNVSQLATKTTTPTYDMRSLSNKTLQPTYDIRQIGTKAVTPTYNMRQLGTKTVTPTYNMRSLSTQTVTPTYDIREKQNQTLSPSYNINCLRGQTLSPTYSMRSLANQVLSPAYDINIKVNKTLTPMYDIKAQKAIRGLRRVYGTMYIAYKESPRATTSVVDEAAISSPRVQQGGAKVCQ